MKITVSKKRVRTWIDAFHGYESRVVYKTTVSGEYVTIHNYVDWKKKKLAEGCEIELIDYTGKTTVTKTFKK